jgi:hypothetical protein
MICMATYALNRAAADFKRKYCTAGKHETRRCLRISSKDQEHLSFNTPRNPKNWPFAVLEGECAKS